MHVSAHTAAVQFHLRLRMLSRARKDAGQMNHSPFGTARDASTTRQAGTFPYIFMINVLLQNLLSLRVAASDWLKS
jgi:hypothetical protein